MAKERIITLLTDFGTDGPYVASMKGVMLRQCPQARFVDISHDIPPHDVWSAAFVLAQAAPEFPDGTVHLAVVDPGVGGDRAILAAQLGGQMFVLPDNGLLTFVQQVLPMQGLATIRHTQLLRSERVSNTFHGRDIMAPAAARLAGGESVDRLGPEPKRLTLLEVPSPWEDEGSLAGQVIYVDRFGNCVSNIRAELIERLFGGFDRLRVWCNGQEAGPIAGAYGFVPRLAPVTLVNSMGLLEVALNQGRACDVFGARIGSAVRIVSEPEAKRKA